MSKVHLAESVENDASRVQPRRLAKARARHVSFLAAVVSDQVRTITMTLEQSG